MGAWSDETSRKRIHPETLQQNPKIRTRIHRNRRPRKRPPDNRIRRTLHGAAARKSKNIVFTLNRFVLVEKYKNPIYETLTEKVQRILKLWKERTKDYEEIYKEVVQALEEIDRLKVRQKDLGFSDLEYSTLLTLEKRFAEDPELIKDLLV